MSSPALRDLWSRCERQHGERRGRRLFWVSLGGNELRSRRSQLQRPNSDGSAKTGQLERRRNNYKESDIDRQRKVLPVARALGRRRSWFHCACQVRLSYLRPSPFLLAISSTEDALCLRKEVEENDADSWRHGSLHAVDERAQRHTRRGTKDAHVASLDEGLARELRDHTRCCTRVQCQGRGRGLEKSNKNCEEHQYLHYQMA